MKLGWLKPNQYQIKNGKLVPRSNTPPHQNNYRVIPYTPLNKPTQDDYYKQTINSLTKQNKELKKIIQQGNFDKHHPQQNNFIEKNEFEKKINHLNGSLVEKEKELKFRREQFMEMDKIIYDQGYEIDRLHQVISGLNRELNEFRSIVIKRDQEISYKTEAIIQYQKTIEQLMNKDETERRKNTANSDNFTQNFMEKQEVEFYSIEGRSWTQNQSIHRKSFMTPKAKASIFEFQEQKRLYTQRQLPEDEESFDKKSSCNSQLSENLKNWTQWAGSTKFSTLDFLHEQDSSVDPLAGSLSGFFSSLTKK